MAYDDLMGLDMYDEGMEAYYSPKMFQDQLIAAGSSGAAILLASWVLPMFSKSKMLEKLDEPMRHRVSALLGVLGGMLGGRLLWDYNRDAAMAVVGGVSGLGLAQLADSFFKDQNLLGHGTAKMYPLGSFAETPEEDTLSAHDQALLAAYGSDGGSALAALETTNVYASRGAFGSLEGTVVNPEQLMSLDAAVVAGETLGGYNPYMS
jgi:hypothetical protein